MKTKEEFIRQLMTTETSRCFFMLTDKIYENAEAIQQLSAIVKAKENIMSDSHKIGSQSAIILDDDALVMPSEGITTANFAPSFKEQFEKLCEEVHDLKEEVSKNTSEIHQLIWGVKEIITQLSPMRKTLANVQEQIRAIHTRIYSQ